LGGGFHDLFGQGGGGFGFGGGGFEEEFVVDLEQHAGG
jgi:hypothetical protein